MKSLVILTLALVLAPLLPAQTGEYTPDQLDQLVGPVALYPDPLLALVLPASTKPDDIQAAAQYLAANGDPSAIDSQNWDASVKGLAHYPDVITWMSQNMDWTQALGAAFAMQPQDVMQSVQQLRAKARAAGTLVDTPQQHIDVEGDDIRIIPAEDNTIYVPEYDPDDVYDVPAGDEGPFITFDAGYPVGAWLGFECDWDDFGIWVGPWHPGWAYRRDWRDAHAGGARWHPDPRAGHSLVRSYFRPSAAIPAPRVIAGARAPGPGRQAPQRAAPARAAAPAPRPVYRGYGEVSRPSGPAPAPTLYSGYGRGTQARDYSARGKASRSAPVRSAPRASAPRSAPARFRTRPQLGTRPPLTFEAMKMRTLQHGARLCRTAALAALLAAPAALAQDGPWKFGSPKDAAAALAAAAKAGDRQKVDKIFGPDVAQLRSGDEKQDQIEFKAFSTSIGHFWRLVRQSDDLYVLDIGDEDWPLPIPLVRQGTLWYFDTAAGKDEILNRRIGEDELTAIGVCRTYVTAQHEYAAEDRDGSGVLKYAQHLKSTEGTKDGLYWKASSTEEESPFGPLVADARAQGYTGHDANGGPRPFHGYRFKVLTSQGADAPGGAFSYIINGNMVAGFALVAYPAHWGESGIMTFIVNQWGKVYERNLGDDSAEIASAMTEFNPGDGWTQVASP